MNSNNGNNDALEIIIKKSVTRSTSYFFAVSYKKCTNVSEMAHKTNLKQNLCVRTWKVAVDFDAFHFMEDEPIF